MRKRGSITKMSNVRRLHLADSRQSAMLLLRLVELKEEARRKPVTRAKLTPPTLKRLWNRRRLSPEFLQQVTDWLLAAGWVFLDAGSTFAVVRVSAVEKWPRIFTKLIKPQLKNVAAGQFDFDEHEHLLWGEEPPSDDTAETADDVIDEDTDALPNPGSSEGDD